ncbi:MAG: N-6 DNA methylase [Dehalococcoidia bacterium]
MPEPRTPDAEALAAEIRRVGEQAHTEEDVRVGVELLLRPVLAELGITSTPAYERHYRAVLKGEGGQSDAVYGHAIMEYEPPKALRTQRGVKRAQEQLERYLKAEARRSAVKTEDVLRRSVGIGLDATHIFFVRYRGTAATAKTEPEPLLLESQLSLLPMAEPPGVFRREGPYEVSTESVAQFLIYLRALRRRELTPERLADAFGPKGDVAQRVVSALLEAFKVAKQKRVETLYSEWDRIFGIVYGQEVAKAVQDARELARQYGAPLESDLKPLLFAVHTYFALIMKLLAAELVSLQAGYLLARPIADLPGLPSDELHRWLGELEDGGLFARQGIHNFLEGDFFGWYLSAWTDELEGAIREMARVLSEYEPATGSLLPEATRDLLKKLYQYLIPREIRHDLGEYYTPDWLAELVLDEVGYRGSADVRLLDPACGSGTFLVLAIRRAREEADERLGEEKDTVESIVSNITGFDLNPLAVIASRTNYLLALGTLVRHKRPLEIPVYLCDSILTPWTYEGQEERGFEALGEPYTVPSVVGDFRIPRDFATKERLEALMRVLEDCARVGGGHDANSFLERVRREIAATDRDSTRILQELFEKVMRLESDESNGIWARLLKNRFAPVFTGKVDLVVGNPPWVNWESLADEYRAATRKLWQRYGLFSLKGHAARLGGGKKDLAMLMLYAAMDNYLKDDGRLGFVITQTVFKTKGAGDGFRRFRIGDGALLRVRGAVDLVTLQPFEGASNRTAVVVLEKGGETKYPVPYIVWRKAKPGRISPDASLEEVRRETTTAELAARPVEADKVTSPWITASRAALDALGKVIGASEYRAYEGSNTGGLNGVYWLRILGRRPDGLLLIENLYDVGRKKVRVVQAAIEPDLVYPLLRGRDVDRWRAAPSAYILIVQDPVKRTGYEESWLKVSYPHTYTYLKQFEDVLRSERRSRVVRDLMDKGAFYSMYAVAEYTFAPYKVVWPEVGDVVRSGVAQSVDDQWLGEKPAVPDHTLILVRADEGEEAAYLAAVLNSAPAMLVTKGYIALHPSPHVLKHVAVPSFNRRNAVHRRLSALSQEAHELAAKGIEGAARLREVEDKIDHLAARLWGLTEEERRIIEEEVGR